MAGTEQRIENGGNGRSKQSQKGEKKGGGMWLMSEKYGDGPVTTLVMLQLGVENLKLMNVGAVHGQQLYCARTRSYCMAYCMVGVGTDIGKPCLTAKLRVVLPRGTGV